MGADVQVTPADITRLEKRIRSINGMAQIQQVEKAQIGVEYVLGIGGFELETVDKEVARPPSPPPPCLSANPPLPCTFCPCVCALHALASSLPSSPPATNSPLPPPPAPLPPASTSPFPPCECASLFLARHGCHLTSSSVHELHSNDVY